MATLFTISWYEIVIFFYFFLVARGLWNNLFQPVGSKTSAELRQQVPFLCPTEEFPYFATAENSRNRQGWEHTSLMDDYGQMMQTVGRNMRCPL
jgi:hypothetical protein